MPMPSFRPPYKLVPFSSSSSPPPALSLCFVVVALLFSTVPSLCHLIACDDHFGLSLPFLLHTIPTTFALPIPLGGEIIEKNIREAKRIYEQQSVDELEVMSQQMCDVFEAYSFSDLVVSLLSGAMRHKMEEKDKDGMAKLEEFINDFRNNEHYRNLSDALTELNAKTGDDKQKELKNIVEKLFCLLLYDQIYEIFEQQIGKTIEEKKCAPKNANCAEFALKWLKQMRKQIRKRYEMKEADIRKATQNVGKVGEILSEMCGTGDWIVKIVRAQIKLSLTISWAREDDSTADARASPKTEKGLQFASSCFSSSQSGSSSSAVAAQCLHFTLFEFLQNENILIDERNDTFSYDVREALCNFLTDYGYSNLNRSFLEIDTKLTKSWFGGPSLKRTLRLIRPKLEAEMGTIWKYGNEMKAFGNFYKETLAKIEQIGAFALYSYLYKALLDQCLFGWTEKSKKEIPILYRQFMCPEEYIGYWLDQMSTTLEGKVEKGKRELNQQLAKDRIKLREMEKMEGKREENGGKNWEENANQTEQTHGRKSVKKYFRNIGRKNRKYERIWGEKPTKGQNEDTIIKRKESPRDETPLNGQQIGKMIKLNEEMAKLIGRY